MFIEPRTGTEIAEEMGLTRQTVHVILKRAMKKFYIRLKRNNRNLTPFDIMSMMMKMLNIPNDKSEIAKYYSLFPNKIKREVTKYLIENSKKLPSGRTMFPPVQEL